MRRYRILRRSDRRGIESHDTLPAAEHALEILNTHEEKYGRGKDYYVLEDTRPQSSPANSTKED